MSVDGFGGTDSSCARILSFFDKRWMNEFPMWTKGVNLLRISFMLKHVLATVLTGLFVISAASQTNLIPIWDTNVFLTDDGALIHKLRSGETMIREKRYEEAKRLKESRPAKDDPEGHWGSAAGGYQLSLRFPKSNYAVDEPVIATVLVRNVTNSVLPYLETFLRQRPGPMDVTAAHNGSNLASKLEGGSGTVSITSTRQLKLFPQTQFKFDVNLGQIYSLTNAGEYIFQATHMFPSSSTNAPSLDISSEKVRITFTNANKQIVK